MTALEHLDDLKRSGLSEETIKMAGIYSVPPNKIRKILGFVPSGLRSAYAIPYSKNFVRLRCFYEQEKQGPKYLSPKGSQNRLYIPFFLTQDFLHGVEPLFITEGEKKALKACQEGIPAVALPGWWAWSNGSKELIPDFAKINLKRKIFLVPDNDIASSPYKKKTNLQQAIKEFAEKLIEAGAEVYVVHLPTSKEKVGLDDFLLQHTKEEFLRLPSYEVVPDQELRRQALEILNSRNPLSLIVQELSKECICREKELKFLYLSLIFPKLQENALIFVIGDTSVGKSYITSCILKAVPGGDKECISSASGLSLIYKNKDLSGKIMWISEFQGAQNIIEILKGLITEKEIVHETVVDQAYIRFKIKADGFLCVTTTTKGIQSEELLNRGLTLHLEASESFKRAVLNFQAGVAEGQPIAKTNYKLLQEVYRLLKPKKVIIPFANEIAKRLKLTNSRILRDYPKILSLIKAHALLNQMQRKEIEGKLIATEDDYKAIYELRELITEGISPLKQYQKDLLELCKNGLTREELCKRLNKSDIRIREIIREVQEYVEITGRGAKQTIRTIAIPEDIFPLPSPDEIFLNSVSSNHQNANSLEKSKTYIDETAIIRNHQFVNSPAVIATNERIDETDDYRRNDNHQSNSLIFKEKKKIDDLTTGNLYENEKIPNSETDFEAFRNWFINFAYPPERIPSKEEQASILKAFIAEQEKLKKEKALQAKVIDVIDEMDEFIPLEE